MAVLGLVACRGSKDLSTVDTSSETSPTADTASDSSGHTGGTGASPTGDTSVPDDLDDCFASFGLDGVCGPGELEWAALGPHGCMAEQQSEVLVSRQGDFP